jgi:hypothetical protein
MYLFLRGQNHTRRKENGYNDAPGEELHRPEL